ncbi:thioesterase domain-containing protein [Undibacterium sp. Tian12W]|uniref:thioesterase domain-containing protein n=1 Tax=Undibacterium sp. Tian12W TaxID=3413054 RepID=UPI003BF17F62
MDAEVNELPVLATGELCIAGDTLARGYLERPDLTAEKFIPDPFSSTGGRLYRTGDICRKRDDSTIEYFGRKDKQIKLRGFRIELGEIENVLRSAPDIRQAVVELSDDSGEPRLLAFVVGAFHKAEVISYLQRHLPDYMVPSVFIKLDALPLMQNGKINRDMLPKDNVSLPVFEKILPRSELEQQLFSIWQTVLKRQDFGVTNNFFEIGGNSLSALRVAAMAKNKGMSNFRLDAFFRHPTIAAFAAQFSKHTELASSLVPLNATRADRNIFVLHPSSGLVFDYRNFAQELDGVANVYGLQFPFEMDAKSWPEDFHGLVNYYVKQMRSMQPHGPYSLIGWSSGGLLAMEIAHLLEESGESLAFIGIVDAKTPAQRKTDLSGKNKDLRRIEAVESSEIDQFWNDLKQHGEGWDSYLLEQENPDRIAENMVLASKYILYVTSGGHDRQIKSDIHVWWSSENVTDLGAERLSEWDGSSQGQLIQMGVIDTSHRGIVKNKQFAEDVKTVYMKIKH